MSEIKIKEIKSNKDDELFTYFLENCRKMTEEEMKIYQDGINKLFKPTGKNLFDKRS